MSHSSRAFVLLVTLMVGPVAASAQNVPASTDLVVAWPDPVLQWNAVTLSTVGAENPIEQQRIAAIVHLAIFEAVNAVTLEYAPYIGSIVAVPGASADAAAIAAAHAVLIAHVPEHLAMLDAARTSALARIPDGPGKNAGIGVGEMAAHAMIDRRTNDGSETPELHVPASADPGEWQLTPSCPPEGSPFLHVGNITPFGVERSDQFRSDPPPSLTSRRYARDFNEVKEVGGVDSPNRPPDRTDVARYYAAVLALPTWNPVAQQVALGRKSSLSENARAFALLNMAMMDAVISVFETKYHYTFWRPETAIPVADTDDNPKTDPDPNFTPFITTPCHPSYPSAHASIGHAAREVLERLFGEGPHWIELSNPAVPDVKLQYTSLQEITSDIDDARIYGGIHFRFDQRAGAKQGHQIGAYMYRHYLRPQH